MSAITYKKLSRVKIVRSKHAIPTPCLDEWVDERVGESPVHLYISSRLIVNG